MYLTVHLHYTAATYVLYLFSLFVEFKILPFSYLKEDSKNKYILKINIFLNSITSGSNNTFLCDLFVLFCLQSKLVNNQCISGQ
jgi:hypothetical protein